MGFDPPQLFFKNMGVHLVFNFQSGNSLGSVKVHSLTLSHTPKNMKCDFMFSHLVCTFASPCLSCEPKAKIATYTMNALMATRTTIVIAHNELINDL